MWNAQGHCQEREKHKMNFCYMEFRAKKKKLNTYLLFVIFVNVLFSCFVRIYS